MPIALIDQEGKPTSSTTLPNMGQPVIMNFR